MHKLRTEVEIWGPLHPQARVSRPCGELKRPSRLSSAWGVPGSRGAPPSPRGPRPPTTDLRLREAQLRGQLGALGQRQVLGLLEAALQGGQLVAGVDRARLSDLLGLPVHHAHLGFRFLLHGHCGQRTGQWAAQPRPETPGPSWAPRDTPPSGPPTHPGTSRLLAPPPAPRLGAAATAPGRRPPATRRSPAPSSAPPERGPGAKLPPDAHGRRLALRSSRHRLPAALSPAPRRRSLLSLFPFRPPFLYCSLNFLF